MRQLRPILVAVLLATAGSAHVTYQVRRGDTLGVVARRFGVPLGDLAGVNGILDVNRVLAGRVLVIPTGDPPAAPAPAPAPAPPPAPPTAQPFVAGPAGTATYVVRQGDSLARVAARHGTTVPDLVARNGIRNPNLIRIGQRLEIPGQAWVCPVQGPRRYRDDFAVARAGGRAHDGVDIFAPRGTPVVASVSGVVRRVQGARAGLAYYLHGDDGHVYYGAHLDAFAGEQGPVAAGAPIGTVGESGNAAGTSPHLHFEIKRSGGAPVNPFPTLQRWCG